jgi:fumarate hydratase class II
MGEGTNRTERDTMGEMEVPARAYYGASTARAIRNFPVSGRPMPRRFLAALGRIKEAAAEVNAELGLLDPSLARAIARAAAEVAEGRWDDQFPVDVFQTGSGTSTNMNANEVVANRAAEILGLPRGSRDRVHPNDHVNLGQSSNDVVPTALHLAALTAIGQALEPSVRTLGRELEAKSRETWEVRKVGRTHLQDAIPIRLGEVFLGHAGQMERGLRRLAAAREELSEVALGGTAVGNGIATHPEFGRRVCARLSERISLPVRETTNHFQAQATLDAVVAASGAVRTVAVSLRKIADDIRWMASGPRCGLGEITLPEVQPGSSIMPGKVNPVVAESLLQACARVLGADAAIVHCGGGGNFELNTMLPLAAHEIVDAVEILGAATANFAGRCVRGIAATERGPALLERSLALATLLVPLVGYDEAAAIAKEAAATGRTIREIAAERGIGDIPR